MPETGQTGLEVLVFQLLGPPLADYVLVGGQVAVIGTPAVGVKAANPEPCKQGFELQSRLVLSPTKDIRQYPARLLIERPPEPPRVLLAADKRPPLVHFRALHLAHHHRGCCSLTTKHQGRVHLVERRRFFLRVVIPVVGLTPNTRAVSRRPLPFSAISTIYRFTSGNHPVL